MQPQRDSTMSDFIESMIGWFIVLPLFLIIIILGEIGLLNMDYAPETDMQYDSRTIRRSE